jgi:hypothetical protein
MTTRQLVNCQLTVSLDGYASGPDHLDDGFMRIMDWVHVAFAWRASQDFEGGDRNTDSDMVAGMHANTGAFAAPASPLSARAARLSTS